MHGLKVWLCAAVVGLCASQAQAQTFIVPTGTMGFPVVAGPVYTPVPFGVRYAPAYQYVTPVTYSAPVVATEVVPTPVATTTIVSPAPTPIVTGYAPQVTTFYAAPTVVTPVIQPIPRRVSVFPRRGVVRVRY